MALIISFMIISLKNETSITRRVLGLDGRRNVIPRPYCVAWYPQLSITMIKDICIKIKVLNHICAFVVNDLFLRYFFVTRIDAP